MANEYGFIGVKDYNDFKTRAHDDVQLPPLQVPQEKWRHILQHPPRLHRQDPALPGDALVVLQVLLNLYEVHHRQKCERGQGWIAAVPGLARPAVHKEWGILELERRAARRPGGCCAGEERADQRQERLWGRMGLDLRQQPVGQDAQPEAGHGAVSEGHTDHG
jgi:hypothetical protein